ncbi:5-histidylcysteine sulfoxide synthase [Alteromonas sp. C1M14]|uniref:5-histidylcysteine sulfoxide synthase n=1 Tax=Alteromonas sp. C1M14 TaxID=2841567 RepID=UPI001C0907BD|nr:5-histidylcysteine sulfoxide synthase [Alteromonas sp. C1M14]MBU2976830.1 5-histidylcysteine sulfoxide synthase [Alteromonas sp. C1M14]
MGVLHTPNLHQGSVEEKRQEILAYFQQSFDTYESLFSTLNSDDAFYQRPEKLRHPLIFYFGHTATFYINKLMLAKQIHTRVNPEFESLFAIGVDEMSWDDLNDNHYVWPTVNEVRRYRAEVRRCVSDYISGLAFSMPITWDSPMWPIIMGIEHEGIHLETSSVLIRQLPLTYVQPQPLWQHCDESGDMPVNQLVDIPGGEVQLGKPFDAPFYGWDNEYGTRTAKVSTFKASQFLVSNGEFLPFVEQGGYDQPQFWETEGRQWRDYKKAQHPTFWRQQNGQWLYRTLTSEIPLPLNWPVDVNYHEAKAFCNWLSANTGRRIQLPTEDEWYRLRDVAEVDEVLYDDQWQIGLQGPASSVPVNKHGRNGIYDVVGNVWQWTETPIYPLDGFKVHPLYDDFTTPTFDNKHNLIKGGSWIATGNEAMKHSRYAFRRHFFQHAGFRYVESEEVIKVNDLDYESDTQVSQYSEFHYGETYFNVPNFAQASVKFAAKFMAGKRKVKALDLGCAVGRASFELANHFEYVDGIDFSARFIKTAFAMQEQKEIRYHLIEEGELTSFCIRRLSDFGLDNVADKVHFSQGDACNLKPQFTGYDCILMSNLVDRVYEPAKLLASIKARLNVGGVLIIGSPFTWLEEYTEKAHWLGGIKDENGETLTSTDALERTLGRDFVRLEQPTDIPFVIRETKRKFQHTLSEFNVFERVK